MKPRNWPRSRNQFSVDAASNEVFRLLVLEVDEAPEQATREGGRIGCSSRARESRGSSPPPHDVVARELGLRDPACPAPVHQVATPDHTRVVGLEPLGGVWTQPTCSIPPGPVSNSSTSGFLARAARHQAWRSRASTSHRSAHRRRASHRAEGWTTASRTLLSAVPCSPRRPWI